MKRFRVALMTALAVGAATEAHSLGAAGLWNMSVKMGGAGMPAMPAMPPEVMAQMQAMGIQMPGGAGAPIMTQICVTPAMAARTEAPPPSQDCRVQNQRANGRTVTGDIVCTGKEMNGTGTFTVTYDSDTHFTQKMSMRSVVDGRPIDMTMDVEGRHINANCGNVRPIRQ